MDERKSAGKQLLLLLLGMLLCGAGIYMFLQYIVVEPPRFGHMFGNWGLFGGRGIPGGMVVVPLIIGVIIWVVLPDNFLGKFISIIGMIVIILGVVSSVELRWKGTSGYEFILVLVMIFGGGALALRILFTPNVAGNTKKDKIDEINKNI